MKKLLTILLITILGGVAYILLTENNLKYEVVKKEFHIRVACPYSDMRSIEFTNDNWITYENINKAFDISLYAGEEDVVMQLWMGKEKDAVKLAKCFKSYQECVDYNKKIKLKYDSLLEYRRNNPLTEETAILKTPKNEECCKVLNIR